MGPAECSKLEPGRHLAGCRRVAPQPCTRGIGSFSARDSWESRPKHYDVAASRLAQKARMQ